MVARKSPPGGGIRHDVAIGGPFGAAFGHILANARHQLAIPSRNGNFVALAATGWRWSDEPGW
jgi:NADPH-dependent glutamate synthase beta subunit-like oxidoreductase